jgi:HEAT repeat protein
LSPRSHAITDAERARIEQVDRFVATGASGVRELIGMLCDRSWTVRRAVVAGLAALGDDAVVPLCQWLGDVRSDEGAIAAAVDALAASMGGSVTAEVLRLTDHANPAVVADGAQILGRRRVAEAVPVLARLVQHDNDNVSVAAIEGLGMIGGTAAVEALIRVVESRRFFRTFPAIQVLSRTGDPRSVPPLAALLVDETYRLEVVRALGRTGMATAIAPITSLLQNPSEAIVRLVAVSLSELIARAEWAGTDSQVTAVLRETLAPSFGRIAAALRGADPGERAAIATLLGRTGDASVLPAITEMLDDTATATATAASDALQHLGLASDDALVSALAGADSVRRAALLPHVRTKQAAAPVRALLRDSDAEVRARACEAIARIGDVASVPQLFDALGDPSARVAHAAVSAIMTLGSSDTERLALAAVRSARSSVRRHAIRLLGAYGFHSAFQLLCDAIHDADRRVAELAITGLGSIEDPRVDDELARHLQSTDDALRSAVMRAAAQRRSVEAVGLLTKGIGDASSWVRYYAAQGLGKVGAHDAPQASRLLIDRLRDPAPQVRIAAIEALSRLRSPDAWDAVCRAAASADPDERRAGLVGVGMQAREGAVDILVEATQSPDTATRLVAVSGLARLDHPRALAALDAAAGDATAEVRDAALSLLAERQDGAAASLLVEHALRSDIDHPVQRALSRPGNARISAIMARLAGADSRAAPILVAALTRMHAANATVALFDALSLPSPSARAAAASALVAANARGAHGAVAKLVDSDPDAEVRRVAAAALRAS